MAGSGVRVRAAGPSLEAIIDAPVLSRFVAAGAAAALLSTAVANAEGFPAAPDPAAAAVTARADTVRPATRAAHRVGPRVYGPTVTIRPRAGVPRAVRAARKAVRVVVRRTVERSRPARAAPRRLVVRHRPVQRRAVQHRAVRVRAAAPGRVGAVVAYVYRQLGQPYRSGGAGRGGFDCSGLTMRAYARAGVRLVHKAARQHGRPVSRARARAGDLVKWGSYHVGVYVGAGWVIHAPKPGARVKRARLWGEYRIVRVL